MPLKQSRWRQFWRMAVYTQLMPVMESGEDLLLVGGQAVIEVVMMRAPHSYCVAVRRPDGSVVQERAPLERFSDRHPIFRRPILRGLATLGQAMSLGIKALRFSAQASLDTQPAASDPGRPLKNSNVKISNTMLAVNLACSLAFFVILYKLAPLMAVTKLRGRFPVFEHYLAFNLADGVIRMLIFLGFLALVSRMRDIHRVFEYHGAEHKVVFNFESGKSVAVENARSFSTLHPRCGTSFLLVVMVISTLVYALAPFHSFGLRLLSRVALLPLIAGISYEVIRFAARRQGTLWASMVAPGLWLQRITTQPPSDDQLSISIRALEGAMALEKEQGGELVIA